MAPTALNAGARLVLSLVVSSVDDLQQKLAQARTALQAGAERIADPRGIYFESEPLARAGQVAFLFPGQGSQRLNMLKDLVAAFPQMLGPLEEANAALAESLPQPLSHYIFPSPTAHEQQLAADRAALTDTRVAQPALGAVELAASKLLNAFGIRPALVGGHSYGEIVALCQAGVLSPEALFAVSAARGRLMAEAAGADAGGMAAIWADRQQVESLAAPFPDVVLANLNAPAQTVISGPTAALLEVVRRCEAESIRARVLPVACAFHSPLVAAAQAKLAEFLESVDFDAPQIEVFSNTTGAPYPQTLEAVRAQLAGHLAQPVHFQKQIETMHEAGARIFVEVGPRRVLCGLVEQILAERQHLAVPLDAAGSGLPALLKTLGQLAAAGLALTLDPCFEGRSVRHLDLNAPYSDPKEAEYGPTTWLINGGASRPWRGDATGTRPPAPKPLPLQLRPPPEPQPLPERAEPQTNGNHVPRSSEDAPRAGPPIAEGTNSGTNSGASNGASSGASSGADVGASSQVMMQYQQLMSRFLATHSAVMDHQLPDLPARGAAGGGRHSAGAN